MEHRDKHGLDEDVESKLIVALRHLRLKMLDDEILGGAVSNGAFFDSPAMFEGKNRVQRAINSAFKEAGGLPPSVSEGLMEVSSLLLVIGAGLAQAKQSVSTGQLKWDSDNSEEEEEEVLISKLFQSLRKEVNTRAESDLGDSRITSNTRPAALSSIRPNGRSTSTPIEAKPKEISDPSFEVHEYLRSSFGGDIEIQSRGSLVSLTTLSEICEDRQFSWEQIDSVVCTMQPRIESDVELSQCFAYDARLRGLVRQLTTCFVTTALLGPDNSLAKDMWRQRGIQEGILGGKHLELMQGHLAASLRANGIPEEEVQVAIGHTNGTRPKRVSDSGCESQLAPSRVRNAIVARRSVDSSTPVTQGSTRHSSSSSSSGKHKGHDGSTTTRTSQANGARDGRGLSFLGRSSSMRDS